MSAAFMVLARKEARALLPLWLAAAGTIAAAPLAGPTMRALFPLGMFAYVVGSLALGAHSIGHEYSNRTLGSLFAQPCSRSSILMAKASVLAVMLLGIWLVAWPFAVKARPFDGLPAYPTVLLPIAGGLLVAPYVTMRLRSQIAGIVFTAGIPGMTYLIGLLVGVAIYGIGSREADALALAVWPPAMLILAASGAVLTTRTFLRLQDVEGGRQELRLPGWLAAADRNPIRPPMWTLVKKELRLQQLTFAMAVLYGGIWAALTITGRFNVQFAHDFPIQAVGVLYFALLPLLMGSLASAQEHQFGTFESQAMLPISFARQWAAKAGVVLVLATVLGVLLPWVLFAPPQLSRNAWAPLTVGIVVLTSWSLYLSSWTRSGIVALALVLPSTVAALWGAREIDWLVGSRIEPGRLVTITHPEEFFTVTAVIAMPIVVLLLSLAARNHRTRERSWQTLAVQAAALAAVFAVTDAVALLL